MRTIVSKVIETDPTTMELLCYKEIVGNETEEGKPDETGLVSGSVYEAVESGTFYQYDESAVAGERWIPQFSIQESAQDSQGGGSGGE